MGRFTKRDHDVLKDLVADCMLQNLSERQSLDYIQKAISPKDGPLIKVSATTLYNLKNEIREDEDRQINLLKREGFIHEHMQRIAELKRGQHDLFVLYREAEERLWERPAVKIRLQTLIRSQLDESSMKLAAMYDALPFVAAVQVKLAREAEKEDKTIDAPIPKPAPSVS